MLNMFAHKVIDQDQDEDGHLEEVLGPVLPHVPVKVGAPVLKDLGQGDQDQGKACHNDDDVQDGGDGAEVSGGSNPLFEERSVGGAVRFVLVGIG